ncbi:putative baseplate assembly protein [Streptomyces sp. ID05-26A]|nr:putative baseplate assembly protein [Streptomyces sp. ID05-26A]
MPLPLPNLDDRRFQQLVDEAKRRVQQHCPEWTDHNVSDPGVTLIETFAHMVDELMYRLNRVPKLNYLKFLDLIGVELFAPTAARVDVTYWLSAAQPAPVEVPRGNQVATQRKGVEDPVVFTVDRPLTIVPCELSHLATATANGQPVDRTDDLRAAKEPPAFSEQPQKDDAVLFGLSDAVPGCAVLLRFDCEPMGSGINPADPPWAWEAWTDEGWAACEVDHFTNGGFNSAGDVVVHVPAGHTTSVLVRQRAGWLRCRAAELWPGQPFYRRSPKLRDVTASTIGGTTEAVHADVVRNESLGVSEGVVGQRFPLARTPVVAGEPITVEVATTEGWDTWTEVREFVESGPEDRHFLLDNTEGQIIFGPAVRREDGTLRHYGAVPAKSAAIRVTEYRTGGGPRGNVARNLVTVQRDPVPFVSNVTNRKPGRGGVAGESVEDAALRGPLSLRTRDRAVTAEDYEVLAKEVAPEVARVRCAPGDDGVRVLVVPAVPQHEEPNFAALQVDQETLERIARHLDARRCVGARVSVEPPFYQGVTVVADLKARPGTPTEAVRARAMDALAAHLDPIRGGADGTGWPFGRPVHSGEVYAVLQRIQGVELVEDVKLFAANLATGERSQSQQRVDLPPNGLAFSYNHQVRVARS